MLLFSALMVNKYFFPPVEPFATGFLQVSDLHEIYWEQCGIANGEPILFVHGGPGAGCFPSDRRFFAADHFRIVLFDQRGCGRSSPSGEIRENDIDLLVGDIEKLRKELDIDQWHVFGGSWGSTLSLYYAQQNPQSCKSIILRGIWMLRSEEIDWWFNKIRFFQPEIWEEFAHFLPEEQRGDLLENYWNLLTGEDQEVALEAAKRWSIYEGSCCTLLPNTEFSSEFSKPEMAWCLARLEAHYFRNVHFSSDAHLLENVSRVRQIPSFIVHGRYDLVCPVKNAYDLHQAWPEASCVIVPDAGHSSYEPGITKELVAATERIRQTGKPIL